ncbi:MAG: hypothetical protein QXS13_05940 [Acidilobaceae archaeon]
MANAKLLIAVALLALLLLSTTETVADIGGTSHARRTTFSASRQELMCIFCHPKIASRAVWSVASGGLLENYRCIACHSDVPRTAPHTREVALGPHASVGCSYCHQIHHDGHRRFTLDTTRRTYGCREHNIALSTWDPPPGISANTVVFSMTYYVSSTTTKTADIAKNRFYRTTVVVSLGVYVIAFMNPYLGPADAYPPEARNLTCLHCHFANAGPAAWDTTTSYIYTHPGECALCHSKLTTVSSGFTTTPSAKAHTVDFAPKANEVYCGRCHSGVASKVSQSVHARLGCRCHGALHISRYNSTASWIILYASPPGTYSVYKDLTDWNSWKKALRYTPANNSALCIWFRVEPPEGLYYPDVYGGTSPCVPIYAISIGGLLRYAGIAYAMRDGWVLANTTSRLFPGSRWLVCYNCHLISMPDGSVTGRLDGIPIKLDGLVFDPHIVTREIATGIPTNLWLPKGSDESRPPINATAISIFLFFLISTIASAIAIRRFRP